MFCFRFSLFKFRTDYNSTIPDISDAVPKNLSKMPLLSKASHQPFASLSFLNSLLPSKSPATKSGSAHASHTNCNEFELETESQPPASSFQHDCDTTAIIMPNTNLFGRNGIKSNLNQLTRIKFGDNANANKTGDKSNNDYCNTSNSGTGDAKAYKLLNSLS